MIRLLPSVRITSIEPQMVLAACIVDAALSPHTPFTEVTCGEEGKHGPGTLHPKGRALDFRTKDLFPADIVRGEKLAQLRLAIALNLGTDFDVVLEDACGANEHLHVEYDPRLMPAPVPAAPVKA